MLDTLHLADQGALANSWHEHQEAAGWANMFLLAGGAFAAFAWWKLTRSKDALIAKWMQIVLILASAMGAATVGRTAWLGGKVIREREALKVPPEGWVAPPKMEHGSSTPLLARGAKESGEGRGQRDVSLLLASELFGRHSRPSNSPLAAQSPRPPLELVPRRSISPPAPRTCHSHLISPLATHTRLSGLQ